MRGRGGARRDTAVAGRGLRRRLGGDGEATPPCFSVSRGAAGGVRIHASRQVRKVRQEAVAPLASLARETGLPDDPEWRGSETPPYSFLFGEEEIVRLVAQWAPDSTHPCGIRRCAAHLIPASTRWEFKVRLVLFLREDEVGAELVAALRDEALDEVAAAVGEQLLNLFDG